MFGGDNQFKFGFIKRVNKISTDNEDLFQAVGMNFNVLRIV